MYWFASYRRVLRACALVPDVDILPDKDRTELGDKVARCLIIGTCCNVCFANIDTAFYLDYTTSKIFKAVLYKIAQECQQNVIASGHVLVKKFSFRFTF